MSRKKDLTPGAFHSMLATMPHLPYPDEGVEDFEPDQDGFLNIPIEYREDEGAISAPFRYNDTVFQCFNRLVKTSQNLYIEMLPWYNSFSQLWVRNLWSRKTFYLYDQRNTSNERTGWTTVGNASNQIGVWQYWEGGIKYLLPAEFISLEEVFNFPDPFLLFGIYPPGMTLYSPKVIFSDAGEWETDDHPSELDKVDFSMGEQGSHYIVQNPYDESKVLGYNGGDGSQYAAWTCKRKWMDSFYLCMYPRKHANITTNLAGLFLLGALMTGSSSSGSRKKVK